MTHQDSAAADDEAPHRDGITRRDLLAGAAGAMGGAVLAGIPALAAAQQGAKAAVKAAP